MTSEARANGWNGFAGIGARVPGGYEYRCDGMPTMLGCVASLVITRRLSRPGEKRSGWLVIFGLEPKPGTPGRFDTPADWTEDPDVVLTFCPTCAVVVRAQEAERVS